MDAIDKIELTYLTLEDHEKIVLLMNDEYRHLDDSSWTLKEFSILLNKFPKGQVGIKVDGELTAFALSIVVDYSKFDDSHTYKEITGDYSFDTHNDHGDTLYGVDVFVSKKYRGLRLGRRLYEFRQELCEELNLRGIIFGGRLPNYKKYSDKLTPKEYISKVREREIYDPVLNFQLSNDFYVKRVLKNYLEGDIESCEYASLLAWDNIYYSKPSKAPMQQKTVIRLGLIQWQVRPYKNMEEVLEQAEYFVDAVSNYRSDFALFPEFFNAPLMAAFNHLGEAEAIRELAKFTPKFKEEFSRLAIAYNINIITGSMPELVDGDLYNVGFLCRRDGSIEKYSKMHVTPDEKKVWGLKGSNEIKTFDTDCGKIGVLICYDSEFPELGRLLAREGMDILFVPFLTDTQNGYSRVKICAQARAVENECYVAIAGCVGNLPKVTNMDIQYAQSAVFTPCDFAFPPNGIKAESTPNTEMILIADVDLELLKELHSLGSVTNLKDRRTDLYEIELKK
ncbi:bifunctional GNAT family N-acetyltransferase/carbon-nitrogen hydrolase family protein [Poseidonibacter lekithochrous]|uniref:bifunctional GNAT family N-acetyltransferase/carbon-nitrogen hydrolase family protein n=1 Tax=Poseidonibacter TaxID=2321187 RepID=UPI001C083043|nr:MULTISPECIES: bifunctional GNAT family N-acetyltransferase/carbon-nitrogen hydrolase family protein [Poseidonibacter]MBU3014554.1 bifunctional GNAT family N-acetyltransferase/carbon-nitrogen hydrolase family protein [Poseidonibacter lekithochrous]MDO6827852.1 bifunctional GNAT family N-acetyltransferase/carbon-nitrogen hydrolase family protein [Poseidonibacter sp. 1_MG-2023]